MRRRAALLALAAGGCAGLAPMAAPDVLLYGSATGVGAQRAQVVIARGTLRGREVAMVVTTTGAAPVRLNYAMDEYVARTHDGRAVVLAKGSVLKYPDVSAANPADPFVLRLPRGIGPSDVTELEARINYGMTMVVLRPIARGLQAPVQEPLVRAPRPLTAPTPAQPPLPSAAPVIVPPMRAGPVAPGAGPAPAVAGGSRGGVGYWSPELEVPVGEARPAGPEAPAAASEPGWPSPTTERAVPTTVEVRQELGSSLPVRMRWNEAQALALAAGEERAFQLLPGHHTLEVSCRMTGIAATSGRVPVTAWPERPVRVLVETRAGLQGAQVRVRVWEGKRLATDRAFSPAPDTLADASS